MFNKIDNFDKALFLFLNNLGAEPWDSFWIFVSNTFWMFCLLAPIILFYTFYNHGKKGVYLIFILLICFCVTDFIHLHMFKNFFERLRPCWDEGVAPFSRILIGKGGQYGFVSGHAANTTSIVTFFLLSCKHVHRSVQWILIFWVLLVAYSRIYLGKHYPLDVVCGILLGFLIAVLISKTYSYIKNINS